MRNPRDFAKPLSVGAPDPVLEIPVTPSRMIHFFDPSNEKIVGKLPDLAQRADILLGNLEDAIAVENKEAARAGLVRVGKEMELGETALWTRINSLESPCIRGLAPQISSMFATPRAVSRIACTRIGRSSLAFASSWASRRST